MDRILFDHIAIAARQMSDAPAVLSGVPAFGEPSGVFRWGVWMFDGGGAIEILEPLGDDGFLHRFLAQRGPGIHHVTFKVPSLDEVCARAEAHGYSIVGRDDTDPSWKEAFLHPREALGTVVQLVESGAAASPSWKPPAGPANPPPPVAILGLRLSCRSVERAERQWGAVVGGERECGRSGELVYRWPGSPMRLAVEIDPAREEGPVAIEFASDRPVDVGESPHPLLGAVFRRGRS
jgi:catechol 2,3-dioxygenase-like lactoylglutathione lyase family enzyme